MSDDDDQDPRFAALFAAAEKAVEKHIPSEEERPEPGPAEPWAEAPAPEPERAMAEDAFGDDLPPWERGPTMPDPGPRPTIPRPRRAAPAAAPKRSTDALLTESLLKARNELEQMVHEEKAKAEELEKENARLRSRAEKRGERNERMKERLHREKEEAVRKGRESLLKSLLPIFDNLERALQVDTANYTEAQHSGAKPILEGVGMVLKMVESSMGAVQAARISTLGKPFDPNVCEAVHRIEDPSVPNNTVLQEYRAAWRLEGRLVRPGQVVVSFGGPAPE